MAIPSKYNVPKYPKTVDGQLVHSYQEEQAALKKEYLKKKSELESHPHHSVFQEVMSDIASVAQTAEEIALSALGAFKGK